jgi:hypothetical protein
VPAAGDCNRDDAVSVAEIVTGVAIALEQVPLARCPAVACGTRVGVDCLVRAVRAALRGCAGDGAIQ